MKRWVAIFLALQIWITGPAFSQADGDDHGERDATNFRFSTSVDAVHLNVSVVKKGKLVTDLKEQDFLVRENDIAQEISYFSRGLDAPLDVVLLVDASGSMDLTKKSTSAINAAIQLIHSLGPEDRTAVYAFDKNLMKLSDFTQVKEEAIGSLENLEPFGSTALYDAVAELSDHVAHDGFGRRAIIVITDGVDTSSDTSVDEAMEKAKGVDLPVYAVRVLSPVDDPENDLFLGVHGAHFRGEDALKRFTQETGGRLFQGSQWGQLAMASRSIREELKTQYRIGYVPSQQGQDGEFRTIEVFTRRRDVEVRTRKGYYPKTKNSDLRSSRSVTQPVSN